jgi:hypothetical protein
MTKLTLIYVVSWVSGSHTHAMTRTKRIEVPNERVGDVMTYIDEQSGWGVEAGQVVFIFEGHSRMLGEDE